MARVKRALCVGAVSAALVTFSLVAAPSATAASRRAIPSTKPTWVAKAHSTGRPSGSTTTELKVYLAPNGGSQALTDAVAQIANAGTSSNRHFLSAEEYHARYDAPDSAVAAVSTWLKDNQLSVVSVEAHHRYLSVRGPVAAVQKAFGVSIDQYQHNGQTVRANSQPATVPASIAPYISTVTGLDTTPHLVKHQAAAEPPPDGFRNARPCSRSYGQIQASKQADFKTPLPKFKGRTLPYAVCGYTGPQFRAAYEGANAATLDGSGVTVAITDAYAAPTIRQDASRYATSHGDGSYARGQFTQRLRARYTDQDTCDPQGWYGEETLDVEAVHAMAPGANIRYYASSSCLDDDLLNTLARVVDDNTASVVTNSWGGPESTESADLVVAYEQVFLQGAMQGVSFLFSSGDNGDEVANTGIRQADYPASDPYVTAVGGTSDAINAAGKHAFQTGWGTYRYDLSTDGKSWDPSGFLYGAGGGTSGLFNRPAYQEGVVPNSFGAGRAVPDLALDADPNTGMLIGETQTFPDGVYYDEYRIGGTSLASPLFAGMTALQSQHVGGRLGFMNPTLYAQAGSRVFTDVTGAPPDPGNVRADYINGIDGSGGIRYSVRTFDQDSSLVTVRGWDDVTGLGSPNANWVTGFPVP